jgi:hypothetical protein
MRLRRAAGKLQSAAGLELSPDEITALTKNA